MKAINRTNAGKGWDAMLACNPTVAHKKPFTLYFGIRKRSRVQRPLPTPKTLQENVA